MGIPIGSMRSADKVIAVDFTVDVSAYASGDLLAQPVKLEGAAIGDHFGGVTTLVSVAVQAYDDVGQNMTAIFHNADPVDCGTLNSAPTISAAKLDSYVGLAQVTTWEDCGSYQVGCAGSVGVEMKADAKGDLWVWLLSKGTGTYASGKLRVTFGFYRS